jgi:signal transduction histidine kinase
MNLRFGQQAALLVFVPLVFEIIFLGYFLLMLQTAENRINHANHAKAVHEATDRVLTQLMQAGGTLANYVINKTPGLEADFRQSCSGVKEQLGVLEDLVKENPKQVADVKTLRATDMRALDLMESLIQRLKNKDATPVDFQQMLAFRKEIAGLAESAAQRSKGILEYEAGYEANPRDEEEARKSLRLCIIAGLVLNVLLASLLAICFYVNTQKRLSYLMENTAKLAKREALHPRLEGSDELARLDNVLQDAAQKLAQAELMKQDFVAMVSHDLRTPLANVRMFLEALTDGLYGKISESGNKKIIFLEEGVDRLMRLVAQLLEVERIESRKLDLEKTSMTKILERSVEAVSSLAQSRRVALVANISPSDTDLLADEARIVQVVVNLLSNALRFSPSGSDVKVAIAEQGDYFELSVADSGIGVPKEYQEVIFQRYRQANGGVQKKDGVGLGLYIAKTLVEQHGGTIGIDSEEGKGSKFWFRVPKLGPQLATSR